MQEVLSIKYTRLGREALSSEIKELERLALEAAEGAYVPYSHFRVGAALLLENGEMLAASNQENAAYPSGICAERNLLFYAGSRYPDVKVRLLVLVASNSEGRVEEISPCGACRQVIMETATRFGAFPIVMVGREDAIILEDSRQLLPFGFDGRDL